MNYYIVNFEIMHPTLGVVHWGNTDVTRWEHELEGMSADIRKSIYETVVCEPYRNFEVGDVRIVGVFKL